MHIKVLSHYSCDNLKDVMSVPRYLLFGYTFCSMLSILNELTLQNELHNCMTNNVFWSQTTKTTAVTTTNIKYISRSREANLGTLVSQLGALPLDHREN